MPKVPLHGCYWDYAFSSLVQTQIGETNSSSENKKRRVKTNCCGVDHTLGLSDNEGTTDHFVVITGRGFDPLLKKPYYTFMENATASVENGCSDMNRFYYTTGNDLSGTPKHLQDPNSYIRYTVSQVRPNNGKKYETTTAYK